MWLVKSTECQNCHAPMEVALFVVALSVTTVSLLWECLPTGDCSGAAKIFGEVEGEVFAGISVEDFDWNPEKAMEKMSKKFTNIIIKNISCNM